MADEAEVSMSEKKKEDWMNSKWRPMMGWMYMIICLMDMVVFPILWSLLQALTHTPITQWNPLTLQGAGLFHIAMGAVLGIAAFGRTQEKLNGANNGGIATANSFGAGNAIMTPTNTFGNGPTFSGNTTVLTNPPSTFSNSGFGGVSTTPTPAATGWGTAPTGVVTGFGGKPAPIQPPDPIL